MPAPTAAGGSLTAEQLLTQLQRRSDELQRATEELKMLADEQARCLHYLQEQQAKIGAAVQHISERRAALMTGSTAAPCSSIAAGQPTSELACRLEAQYCEGLLLLLRRRLLKANAQLSAAQNAFTGAGGALQGLDAVLGESDEDEEDAVM